jgi:hypothetical protein
MAATKTATIIDLSGPFFQKDPAKTFQENVRIMLEALAKEGEADVRAQVPSRTGATAAGIIGRIVALNGKQWHTTAIISQRREFPWHNKGERGYSGRGEAIYRGGKLEAKVHMFRRTASRIRSSRAVQMAELTKNLN